MTTKKRSILLSVMLMVLCLALVAVGTYALFSDQVTLTNHLQAGKLDVTLTRTSLTTKSLNEAGYLVDTTDDEDVDFSNATDKNVFNIGKDTLLVPRCKYSAEMEIKNNGDVAFAYWLEIRFDDSDDLAFADQLQVTVTKGTDEETALLSAGLNIGSAESPIGELAVTDEPQLFTVSVVFVDDDDVNNDAMGQSLAFDLIVHAVQVVTDKA